MIFLRSFSGNRNGILFLAVSLFACACATVRTPVESADSLKDRNAPLVVESLFPDREPPQAAEMTTVTWKVSSSGGVGVPAYTFQVSDGTSEQTVQEGPSASWPWSPSVAGTYRVRAVARDSLGNVAEGSWSSPYEVVPKLVVESLFPDREAPQAAEMTTVTWKVSSSGGVGVPAYTFLLSDGTSERTVQEGPSASWSWSPSVAGTYRVRAVARDSLGNVAERAWALDYEVSPVFERSSAVAVMPIENLTGGAAPLREIRATWIRMLKARGVSVLEEGVLEEFLTRHRIRYTGGLTKELGEALRKETGAKGVLFASLDLYDEIVPPRVALTARLVYAGVWAGILWMDSVAMMGDDSPGILGIGRIHDPRALREKMMDRLAGSLEDFMSGRKPRKTAGPLSEGEERFRPKEFHRSPRASLKKDTPLVVAVLPFRDENRRRHIGEIMMLHFVQRLAEWENVEVVEPGVVRQALLTSRTIMEQGLSLPQADLLRELLGVDLVLAGWVMDYDDFRGPVGSPKVRFSSEVIDTRQRQVTSAALSYGDGDDRVFFFGAGKVNTAHVIASRMVREVVVKIMEEEDSRQAAGEK